MASRYIQKYPIPQDFPSILKNFSREILRDQPTNIIEYAANYFEALESGKSFKYESAFNVPKEDKQYELKYEPQKAEEMTRKDLRINDIAGAISKESKEVIEKVVDSVFLKFDINKNGCLEGSELDNLIQSMYKDGFIDVLPTEGQVR